MIEVRRAVAAAWRAAAKRSNAFDTVFSKNLTTGGICALALSFGLGSAAYGQEVPTDSSESQAAGSTRLSIEEVTVTGSRIRRTTDFNTPNPTTVVDASALSELGIVNVGDAVKELPVNLSNNTPATTGNSSFFAGSIIANLRGLNPFFGSRTLTLVNNRRFVPTNQGDGVDLNFIPSLLIERVDIVTGGASAAYGSGAISGVQNIFLNRDLEGGRFEADYYKTAEGDGEDYHFGGAYGASFFDDRLKLVVGAEYQDSEVVKCLERNWCQEGNGFVTNRDAAGNTFASGPNQNMIPNAVRGTDLRYNQLSTAGVFANISAAPGDAWGVDAAGTGITPFKRGALPFSAGIFNGGTAVPGGDGLSIYHYTNLRAPVERKIATAMATYRLTDTINLSVDLSWGDVETKNDQQALADNNNTIRPDNAFLTPALAAARDQAGGFFNKDWSDQVDTYTLTTTEVKRAAIGLDGVIGDTSWTWDAYFQYGETDRLQFVNDNRHLNRYLFAVDSVIDPVTNQPACRVTVDPSAIPDGVDPRLAIGCVPLNPFGTGPLDPAAKDYAFGFLRENLNYKQQVLAGSVTGDLWKGFGAGPVQAAFGLEFRTEKGENIAAEEVPSYERTDYLIQYGESFAGDVDVTEVFSEFSIPVLNDKRFANLLEFNTAARYSKYENQGKFGTSGEKRDHDIFTWKISGVWEPIDGLRFRATQSRDIRAANFRELYYGQIIQSGGVFGYCGPAGTVNTDPCTWNLLGNVNLDPEEADTTTFGIVITPPDWRLQFAADYFKIEIDKAIQPASVRAVIDGCLDSGIQEYCDQLVFDGTTYTVGTGDTARTLPGIESLRALAFNGNGYTYKGIDFSSSYAMKLGAGALNFRLIATHMIDQIYQPIPGAPFRNLVGQTGTANNFLPDYQSAPDWIANLTATYSRGPASITTQIRYVSDGIRNFLAVEPGGQVPVGGVVLDDNRVPSYAVVTLAGTYKFQNVGPLDGFELFTTINNLFDKEPPMAAANGNGANANGGTNATFFDTMGRAVRVGFRMSF